ncbi:protocadherin-11 X-linked [Patella vulgata]|uniref:protocadherin-11 X-linked n=1 Tax=Patella vulgata TaxID=6465 RepID=UPI0021802764|nr:protocadherin-11 X-linked [Patella vulgata]
MEKCVVFCVLLLCFIVCSAVELTFHVDEEQDRGTLVGRISDSSDLQKLLSVEVLGSLKYSFLVQGYPHSVLFTIVNNTGLVYTAQKLDRELLCGFSDTCILDLEVAVQSTISQFFRKERVKVVLNDINDNRPEFTSSSINVEISESVSVNSSYQLEAAVDRDIGNNSLKGYELVSNSDIFDLRAVQTLDGGSVVSLVVTKSLDREKRDRYNVTVVAHDGGSPSLSSSLSVIIKIKDVNDNPPVFSSPTFNVTVTETSTVNTVVVTLTATDADTPPNGVAFYRFSPLLRGGVTDYFRINETTGVLSVRSSLNDIQGKTMKGVVECLDHGSPPLIAQALVIINIEDTTNNRPSINLNLLADGEVSEYAQPGTPVAHIAVLDPDTGRNGIVRCSLISSAFELQGLDVDEYKIIVARTIDRERESSFNVTLTCFDAGDPPMNRSIVFPVHVKDENDNSPIFSRGEYLANITENNEIGEVILQVSASDWDTGLNSKLRFFSPEGDKLGVSVNANGQIIAERKFDREVEPNLRFKVFAADMGLLSRTSNTLVEITILDVNDATPTFSTSTYVFSVFENQKSNTAIGTVTAHDGDEGVNKEVQYSIFREKSDDKDIPFIITPSGEILTTRPLDREKKRRYEFVVVATDGGESALHGSATVIVDIEDENDNKPVITFPTKSNHSVALSYLTPPNALILAVTATDDDWGDNSRVSYHIALGTDQKLFLVDSEIGLVKTRRALTTADIGPHNLFIQVKDGGQPSRITNVTIKIDIVVSNETMLSSKDNEENTLVVIILGTLTGVIAVAVIITIVIIRKIDNRKKHEQDMLTANQTTINPDDVMKLSGPHYVIKSGDVSFDSTHSSSINGSNDSADKLLRERETDLQRVISLVMFKVNICRKTRITTLCFVL